MRLIMALVAVAALMAFVASTASAGEITGNGKLLTVHGNSPCAYSGQEDLQWLHRQFGRDAEVGSDEGRSGVRAELGESQAGHGSDRRRE